jgi:hypothetical protein
VTADIWGPLPDRYGSSRPRRLLALDGGGIRGVLTLAILAEVERQLAITTRAGASFRLCQFLPSGASQTRHPRGHAKAF